MANDKATIGVGAVLVAGILAYNYYDMKEMSDLSQQTYLRLYGEGIYEYHALKGKWPSKVDDLAITSLPRRYPHWWKAQLGLDADAIVCPKNLKPDPKENGHVILCYHHKGLDAEMGRMWVCWGDLRTECITPESLQESLNKQKNVENPAPEKGQFGIQVGVEMASETPGSQRKLPMKLPLVGLLLGLLVGSVVAWVTLNDVLESEVVLQFSFLRQIAYLIPMLICGCIGGIIHLRKQGRTAEIAGFLRIFLGAALWVVFFFRSMYLGAWLGVRLFDSVGYWIGWFTGAVLFLYPSDKDTLRRLVGWGPKEVPHGPTSRYR